MAGDSFGRELPSIRTEIPGPRSITLTDTLADVECPALTARRARRREMTGAPHDPVVWETAFESNVRDVDGNVFVDMVAGFGAALIGHGHPRVVGAVQRQAGRMMHALGDVHPSAAKIALEARLASLAPWPGARVILGLSGSDAVEAALKTALLATGRPGVLAFAGGYHGLSHGPLSICGYSAAMREPFRAQLNQSVTFAPYPIKGRDDLAERAVLEARAAFARGDVGAMVVEPVLGRGGVASANGAVVDALVKLAHEHDAVVIADEIYTGLRRLDGESWIATSRLWREAPDIVCLGKALGGTMPVSACLVRDEIAAAWGDPDKEVIHTSTFLGNPLACEAALAALDVLDDDETVATMRSTAGALWSRVLSTLPDARELGVRCVDGAGLLFGVVLDGGITRSLGLVRKLLERGYIALPGGGSELGATITFTPPMTLSDAQIDHFGDTLRSVLREVPA